MSLNLKFAQRDASLLGGTPNIPDTRTQLPGHRAGSPAAKKTPSDKTKSAFGHFFHSCNIVHCPHLHPHQGAYHGNRDVCELLFGGLTWQSYQALGPLGPLLSLTLITGCGFMFRVDIEDTKYSGPLIIYQYIHFLVCTMDRMQMMHICYRQVYTGCCI